MMRAYGSPFQLGVPPVVKNLLIINGLFFLLRIVLGQEEPFMFSDEPRAMYRLDRLLSWHWPSSPHFEPWQVVTHMFMHQDWKHLLLNMLSLFMFGSSLEFLWGPRRFLFYYFACGLGALGLHLLVQWHSVRSIEHSMTVFGVEAEDITDASLIAHFDAAGAFEELAEAAHNDQDAFNQAAVPAFALNQGVLHGASGAIFGILLAFGMMFPNEIIFAPGIYLPLPAKFVVLIFGSLEFIRGFSGANDGVAHFAHLGGMLVGIFLILHWKKRVIL